MRDLPLLIVCLTISAYWLRVGAMAHRARRRHGTGVGVVPERASERAMWLVLVPIVVAGSTLHDVDQCRVLFRVKP